MVLFFKKSNGDNGRRKMGEKKWQARLMKS